jgi:hypothetical protein
MKLLRPAAAMLLILPSVCPATVLTFEIDDISDFFGVPPPYGDRVTAETMQGPGRVYHYDEGAGFTPNVLVSYEADLPLVWRSTGWGDLDGLVWAQTNTPNGARIVLTPDPGYRITLRSFDVGCHQLAAPCVSGDAFSAFLILTGSDVALDLIADAGGNLVIGGEGHATFSSEITSSEPITIFWDDIQIGELALDNIHFTQSPVPIPAPGLLLASAAGLLFGTRRRSHTS